MPGFFGPVVRVVRRRLALVEGSLMITTQGVLAIVSRNPRDRDHHSDEDFGCPELTPRHRGCHASLDLRAPGDDASLAICPQV